MKTLFQASDGTIFEDPVPCVYRDRFCEQLRQDCLEFYKKPLEERCGVWNKALEKEGTFSDSLTDDDLFKNGQKPRWMYGEVPLATTLNGIIYVRDDIFEAFRGRVVELEEEIKKLQEKQ